MTINDYAHDPDDRVPDDLQQLHQQEHELHGCHRRRVQHGHHGNELRARDSQMIQMNPGSASLEQRRWM